MLWDYRISLAIGKTLCPCCGHNVIYQSDFHAGHIKSESLGGALEMTNLVPICGACNLSMATTNMKIFMNNQFRRKLDDIMRDYKKYGLLMERLVNTLKPGKTTTKCSKFLRMAITLLSE